MSLWSTLSELHYDERDDDVVRFRECALDDDVSAALRSLREAVVEERSGAQGESSDDDQLLALFARRRTLRARRGGSTQDIVDALDAYSLVAHEYDVPWESWFKAALFIGRELGLELDGVRHRFSGCATDEILRRANVAFDALARIDDLAQCHIIEVATTYGPGFIETTVVRDQGVRSWGGITGQPVSLGQFQVDFAPTTNLAQLTVTIADALEATQQVLCSSIRQDQLVGATFDLVTSGSYLDSLGCLSFFADGVDGQPSFSVVVAEVGPEDHYDVHYDAPTLVADLAEAADDIEEQSALAIGPCVVVFSALPSFEEFESEHPVDLDEYLDIVRAALATEEASPY